MLVATFSLPTDAVALAETFEECRGAEFEAERIAAHSTRWAMPCFWVRAADADFEAVDDALRADPSIDSIVDRREFDEERYYHLEWSDAVESRINDYVDKEGSILEAAAAADGWRVTFRFVSRDQFDAFRDILAERGHAFELLELTDPDSPRASAEGLTPAQRDALVAAYERGYYEVPREISTRELAAELDVSHQSLSELLRRATGTLIDSSLTTGETDGR